MKCPKCKSNNSKVLESRDLYDWIRRRRECIECKFRYTTLEKIARKKQKKRAPKKELIFINGEEVGKKKKSQIF